MRVLLISATRETINMRTWPLGLGCVAAAAEAAGHEVRHLDLMRLADPLRDLEGELDDFQPQAIGLSVRNIDDQNREHPTFLLQPIRELVACCRQHSGAPLILGGAGYSLFPESCLEYLQADMGIQGEGERVFPALLERLAAGQPLDDLPGLYVRGRGLQGLRVFSEDLDALPLPHVRPPSPEDARDETFLLPLQTKRGCANRCSYCSTGIIEGHLVRKRSPERLVEALRGWVEAGHRRFYFVDNTFNLPEPYARDLCARLAAAGLGIRFRCIIYPVRIGERLVRDLARAGCFEVSVGFESGCQRMLRGMNKHFAPESIRRTMAALRDQGIRRMGFLLLGGPGETRQSVEESLAFADSLGLEALRVTVGIRLYPGTPLAGLAAEEGLIGPDDDLLTPRFYLARDLEEWLPETVRAWAASRPNWIL